MSNCCVPLGEKLLHVPSNIASSSKTYTANGAINSLGDVYRIWLKVIASTAHKAIRKYASYMNHDRLANLRISVTYEVTYYSYIIRTCMGIATHEC